MSCGGNLLGLPSLQKFVVKILVKFDLKFDLKFGVSDGKNSGEIGGGGGPFLLISEGLSTPTTPTTPSIGWMHEDVRNGAAEYQNGHCDFGSQ